MKKIIWISSYPKSGNTWLRYLIANYFFNNDMVFDKTIIKYIDKLQLPDIIYNGNLGNTLDLNHIAKFWIPAQEELKVVDGQVTFLKTHNANVSFRKNSFTNEKLTKVIIYITRDPREVVVSGHNYFGINEDKLIDKMCNDKLFTIGPNRFKVGQNEYKSNLDVISTWDMHYNSWINKMPNIPKILIRYEDLIKDTEKVFRNTIIFLSKILNFKINEKKIQFSIDNSKFETLSKVENQEGFGENESSQKFFRSGKISTYRNILTESQINIINAKFRDLMKHLKYL